MKKMKSLSLTVALFAAGTIGANAGLTYDFSSGLDGFVNASLEPAPAGWSGGMAGKISYAGTGWTSPLIKEFAWGPGGGNANQQTEMQSLAFGDLDGNEARLQFDIIIDDASFPNNAATWFQFYRIGNSDGPLGWTQTQIIDGWHDPASPGNSGLRTWHVDVPFSAMGWEAGDSWFQVFVGLNGGAPVNYYIDNVVATLVPEPATFSLVGLGALALLISRRRE
jgi:hypothetical protein